MVVEHLVIWLTTELTHPVPVQVLCPAVSHLGLAHSSLVVQRSDLSVVLLGALLTAVSVLRVRMWLSMATLVGST